MQNVVSIGRDDEVVNRQPHTMRQIAGIDISKVARGDRKINGAVGPSNRKCGVKVINDLSHDPSPIDRVNCDEGASLRQEGFGNKTGLNQCLTIIKVTPNSEVVNVIARHRCHLSPLHIRYPAIRVKNKNIHVVAVATTLDRSATGVAGRGAHDHHLFVPPGQNVIEQPAQQLQGKILKRQRWPMEQFQKPLVTVELFDGGDCLMPEIPVARLNQLGQRVAIDTALHEGRDHRRRQLTV